MQQVLTVKQEPPCARLVQSDTWQDRLVLVLALHVPSAPFRLRPRAPLALRVQQANTKALQVKAPARHVQLAKHKMTWAKGRAMPA